MTEPDPPAVSVPARAALAGNPSDGFGGAVVSVIVPSMRATVSVGHRRTSEPIYLIDAVLARPEWGCAAQGIGYAWSTTIPQSVGLAGSSALVIAAIRAMAEIADRSLSDHEVATMAHSIERADLGIAGGWQDQVVQSHGVSCLMEFGDDPPATIRVTPIDTGSTPLFVAWTSASEASGAVHTQVRSVAEEQWFIDAMERSATAGRAAFRALQDGSVHDLKTAIVDTYRERAAAIPLDRRHVDLVNHAHDFGAAANYAGSGGAIVGVLPKDADGFIDHMRRAGYGVHHWTMSSTSDETGER